MLMPNVFHSLAPSLYLRAFSTSPPTVNEPKDLERGDTVHTQGTGARCALWQGYVLLEENKALLDKYQRALAENENTRKRVQKQLEDMKNYAIQNFCKDLLEISDNLDLALQSSKRRQKKMDSLQKAFAKHGLVQIIPKGEVFDPEKHDAVYEVSSDSAKPGDVVEVLKSGYILNGRVIRPAKVAVAPIP
uniref:GrpE protein homolog n=1 Tax=Ditylenchus dipsaci TaxID=166011 RepID=A0A915E3J5_9BILA